MWDAIVVGTGVMGAVALASMAAAGLKVLGVDRFAPPHALGSSHGETRVRSPHDSRFGRERATSR